MCSYIALITSHSHLQYFLTSLGVPTIFLERKRLEDHLNEAQLEKGSNKLNLEVKLFVCAYIALITSHAHFKKNSKFRCPYHFF